MLEQPGIGRGWAGIQIPPNAMKVFAALGLDAALDEIAFRPLAIEARMGRSGLELFHIPLAEHAVTRWGAPYLHIHRADYIAVLAAALRAQSPDALQLGGEVAGYSQTEDVVEVRLADGRRISGDALIGADGIHSPVREQMLGAEKPIFTGNIAWRAVVPMAALGAHHAASDGVRVDGPGKHCVTYRLRRGTLANFVGVVERDDWTMESWTERGTREEALADFADWHPTITRLLGEADRLYRWALFDRAPLPRWVDSHVALLGDAAHPMLPFMAQGAAMAVEDAWVVAREMTQKTSPARGQAYQHLRQIRASRVQAAQSANAKTFTNARDSANW